MAMASSRGRTSDARTNQLDHMLYVLKRLRRVRVKYVSLSVSLHVVLSIAWIKPISLAGRQSRGSKISVVGLFSQALGPGVVSNQQLSLIHI